MAEIAPFRGVLYNHAKADLDRVVAPPFDVIEPEQRELLAAREPHNCVRLILPEGDPDVRYQNAADTLAAWRGDQVLVRDPRPAIYRYHQVFSSPELGPLPITRRGFIAAVRLQEPGDNVIRPHERTLSGPKTDRFRLMTATRAHTSQVFAFYSDPSGRTDDVFKRIERGVSPAIETTTDDGTRHLLWRVDDAEVIGAVRRVMAPLQLFIADGHHRYATMVAYRDRLREEAGGLLPTRSAAEFGTLFLTNMEEPGLVILPIHRLLSRVEGFDRDSFLARVAEYFSISTLEGAARDAAALRAAVAEASQTRRSFAAVFPGHPDGSILSLKGTVNLASLGLGGPRALTDLDVIVLHELVFARVLGIGSGDDLKAEVSYPVDTEQVLAAVAAGAAQVGFVMSAPRLKQVCAIANSGTVMPQKSTFFFPKIASGLVFNTIDPDEELR